MNLEFIRHSQHCDLISSGGFFIQVREAGLVLGSRGNSNPAKKSKGSGSFILLLHLLLHPGVPSPSSLTSDPPGPRLPPAPRGLFFLLHLMTSVSSCTCSGEDKGSRVAPETKRVLRRLTVSPEVE